MNEKLKKQMGLGRKSGSDLHIDIWGKSSSNSYPDLRAQGNIVNLPSPTLLNWHRNAAYFLTFPWEMGFRLETRHSMIDSETMPG